MQMLAEAYYRQRLLYYAARLYSHQLVEGEAYNELPPAYLISFVNSVAIRESPVFHTRFVLRDADHNLTFADDFAALMIELPKFPAAAAGPAGALESWCYFLINASRLDTEALPAPLTGPAIRKAMETLRVISEKEREREQYESRLKRQLDDFSLKKYYAQRDAYYAQMEVEVAQIKAEFAQKDAEFAQMNAELLRRQEEQLRRADRQRREQQALADRYQALADQLQALADRIDDPDTKADLLRQRDEQLAAVAAIRESP